MRSGKIEGKQHERCVTLGSVNYKVKVVIYS
jgi:hypothetical protein